MGRSQFTVAGAAAAFGLATVIIAAQAPAQPPAGRGQGQPAAAQPGGPPPNPADPSLPQGQGGGARSDGEQIRKAAITHRVSSVTTVEAALAAVQGMAEHVGHDLSVRSLQEYHACQ